MEFIQVDDLSAVPDYLRCGALYRNLTGRDEEDDTREEGKENMLIADAEAREMKMNKFEFPRDCLKGNTEINSEGDLRHILMSMRYWVVESIPGSVIEFALILTNREIFARVAAEFENELVALQSLRAVAQETSRSKRLVSAMRINAGAEIFRYLYGQDDNSEIDREVADVAARLGLLEVLRYAHEQGCAWDIITCRYAAESGHLDCLQYAHEQGCSWDSGTCSNAAEGGHLDCLRYAHEQGCPWDSITCYAAAANGLLDCLQYVHEQECPWDSGTCYCAAEGGQLDCLQYAHEQGCPWDSRTCHIAAESGHLDCLQYAHEQGCPWDSDTCREAAEAGKLDCLQYAIDNGCPCREEDATKVLMG